jgi:hypothetical protein
VHPQDYTLAQVGPMGDILLKLILFRKISFCPFIEQLPLFTSAQTCEVRWVGALPNTSTSLNLAFQLDGTILSLCT